MRLLLHVTILAAAAHMTRLPAQTVTKRNIQALACNITENFLAHFPFQTLLMASHRKGELS
jgi:hypothetical protein